MLIRSLVILWVLKINSFCVSESSGSPSEHFNIQAKIINGNEALAEDNGFQVSIRLKELDWIFGFGHICGGALILPSVVITAAHCMYNYNLKVMRTANELAVSMGSMNRFDRSNSTVFEVLDISYKDTFNSSTFVNDLAIIKMNGFISKDHKSIKPIEINWNIIPDDTMCQVSGWGETEDGGLSDFLMFINLPIVNKTICAENYNGSMSDGMICAGYMNGKADACGGDSGGPLVCNGKLTGIVSFGIGCGTENFPGIYTDLKYHSKWIKNVTDSLDDLKSLAITGKSFCVFLILFSVLI